MDVLTGCCFSPIGWIVSTAATVFWIWMLVDCAAHEKSTENRQWIWIIVIALTHAVGALLYFFLRRPVRIEEEGE